MDERSLLRHLTATIAYRADAALEGAPADLAGFHAGEGARTALELCRHIADLVEWSARLAGGPQAQPAAVADPAADPWPAAVDRIRIACRQLDEQLARADLSAVPVERLVQGPLADSLTHVGQLALLRRLAGHAMAPHNYFRAEVPPAS